MLLKIRFVMVKEYLHSNRTPSNNLTCLNKYMVKNIWCLCRNCYRVKASTRFSMLLEIFHWAHIEKDPCPMRAMTLGPSSSVSLLPPALQSSPWAALLIIWSCPVFSPKGCFGGSKTHDKSDLICVSCFHMTQFYPDNVYNLWGPENGREFSMSCPWTTRLSCSFSTIVHHSLSLSWSLSESTLRSHSQY